MKKAQGMPMNVIIIAVIVLLVLVVLVFIFTGRMGIFTTGVKETANCNEICKASGYKSGSTTSTAGTVPLPGAKDGSGNQCYCSTATTEGAP